MAGCEQVGKINSSTAHIVWDQMIAFASYAFNRAHAAAYSYLSYACAWLKANYTVEFFCALMSIRCRDGEKWKKAPEFVSEAKQLGIALRPPDINISCTGFVNRDHVIYWGLQAIKGIGETTADAIVNARGNVSFTDIYDFVGRVDRQKVNVGNFKKLIIAGAFDSLGYSRKLLEEKADEIYGYFTQLDKHHERVALIAEVERENAEKERVKKELADALALAKLSKKAGTLTTKDTWHLNRTERLKGYREQARRAKLANQPLDTYLTTDELEEYEQSLWLRRRGTPKPIEVPDQINFPRAKELALDTESLITQKDVCGAYIILHPIKLKYPNATPVNTMCIGDYGDFALEINRVKEITTKRGRQMAFAAGSDGETDCEIVIFSSLWEHIAHDLENKIILVSGKIESEQPYKIIANSIDIGE